jgi:hypothetical protein
MHCTHTRLAPFENATMCIDCLEVFAEDDEGTEDPTEPWVSIDTDAVVKISGGLFQNLCEIAATAAGAMEWKADEIVIHSGMRAPSRCVFMSKKAIQSRKVRTHKAYPNARLCMGKAATGRYHGKLLDP